ncbi:MAG: hypothetical protein CVT89_02255 [Candidatus Altiarchaeales archaeon HGW-Altiarchaeales-2]|nr:MAG: hypothetical protein CVT89_02255 [Candidatus Altiarchaeales archaeon HGW-Altiarchaeales-2]
MAILLAIDTIWGFLAHIGFSQEEKPKTELRWAEINFFTVAVLFLYFSVIGVFPPTAGASEGNLAIGILVISVVRTVIDYWLCWEFYYPSD